MVEIAAQDEEDGSLPGWDAGGVAVKCAAGAGGVGVIIDRGMGRGIIGSACAVREGLFAVVAAGVEDGKRQG